MYNLLDSIASAARNNQGENISSDVLAYLLNGIPEFQAKFLELLHPAKPITPATFRRECVLGDAGRVDFKFDNGTTVLYIENKPWFYSTIGNQLSAYADAIKSEPAEQKILCLMATDENKAALLNEIAVDAKTTVSGLPDYFQPAQFTVLTWKTVLDCLGAVQPENTALKLWHQTLLDFIGVPVPFTSDDVGIWQKNKDLLRIVKSSSVVKLRAHGYNSFTPIRGDNSGENFYGWYIMDTVNNISHWVGIDKNADQQERNNPVYITQTSMTWKGNCESNCTALTENMLIRCGYKQHNADKKAFYKRLFEPNEKIQADTLTTKIITVLDELRNVFVR